MLPMWIRISPPLGSIRGWRTTENTEINFKIVSQNLESLRKSLEPNSKLTEEQGQVVPDYKVQGYMVPSEFQAQGAQEAHGGLGHHGAHGVQVALKDLLGPAKKQKTNKNQKDSNG